MTSLPPKNSSVVDTLTQNILEKLSKLEEASKISDYGVNTRPTQRVSWRREGQHSNYGDNLWDTLFARPTSSISDQELQGLFSKGRSFYSSIAKKGDWTNIFFGPALPKKAYISTFLTGGTTTTPTATMPTTSTAESAVFYSNYKYISLNEATTDTINKITPLDPHNSAVVFSNRAYIKSSRAETTYLGSSDSGTYRNFRYMASSVMTEEGSLLKQCAMSDVIVDQVKERAFNLLSRDYSDPRMSEFLTKTVEANSKLLPCLYDAITFAFIDILNLPGKDAIFKNAGAALRSSQYLNRFTPGVILGITPEMSDHLLKKINGVMLLTHPYLTDIGLLTTAQHQTRSGAKFVNKSVGITLANMETLVKSVGAMAISSASMDLNRLCNPVTVDDKFKALVALCGTGEGGGVQTSSGTPCPNAFYQLESQVISESSGQRYLKISGRGCLQTTKIGGRWVTAPHAMCAPVPIRENTVRYAKQEASFHLKKDDPTPEEIFKQFISFGVASHGGIFSAVGGTVSPEAQLASMLEKLYIPDTDFFQEEKQVLFALIPFLFIDATNNSSVDIITTDEMMPEFHNTARRFAYDFSVGSTAKLKKEESEANKAPLPDFLSAFGDILPISSDDPKKSPVEKGIAQYEEATKVIMSKYNFKPLSEIGRQYHKELILTTDSTMLESVKLRFSILIQNITRGLWIHKNATTKILTGINPIISGSHRIRLYKQAIDTSNNRNWSVLAVIGGRKPNSNKKPGGTS